MPLNSQLSALNFFRGLFSGGGNGRTPKSGTAKSRSMDPSLAAWVRGDETSSPRPLVNAYAQVGWVYRAVNTIAEQVANIPFRFAAASEGKDRITTGKLQQFYERPHPRLNGYQYWELRVVWLLLRGECFRIPVFGERGGRRVLERVMMLDPERFTEVVHDGELHGWRYRSGGNKDEVPSQVFLPEEVWHDRLANPFDPWRGLSPLSVAAAAAGGEYAASQFMRGLMENNGDAGLIVQTPDQLEPEQREELLAALRERKRGLGRADRPLLLWGGVEVAAPTAATADLRLLEHRRFNLSEICAIFGVPEEVLASLSAAKYDIMAGARLNFIENRIAPLCRRLEAEEQACVRAIDPNAKGFFEVDEHPVLSTARRERLKTAQVGFGMGIPLNELNRALDLGFKPLPWGDQPYVASNMRPVSRGD